MKWIVLKQIAGGRYSIFGPITAESEQQACGDLARGDTAYVAQERGRYFAIPLGIWQKGCFDFTKSRGVEAVFPRVS